MAEAAQEGLEELVRRIIRSAQEGVNSSRANVTSSAVSTAEEELRQRFNLPRGTGRSETATSTTGSCSASTANNSLSLQNNPQENYGYTNSRRQRRLRQAPYHSRNRGSSTTRPQTANATKLPPTLKEAILLPKPSWKKVPKYAKKADLQERGFIIDSLPIERHWSESQLKEKLTMAFEDKLRGAGGERVG